MPRRPADVAASLDELGGWQRRRVGAAVLRAVAEQGFCVVDLALPEGLLRQALQQAQALEACGRFAAPPAEVVGGLLGEEGSTEVCELDCGEESCEPAGLRRATEVLASLGEAFEPYLMQEHLGFATDGRSNAVLHLARGGPEKGERRPALDELGAEHWLDQYLRHRLMAVLFLGTRGGSLVLQPLRTEAAPLSVEVCPGELVVLRADALSRRFIGSRGPGGSAALSCFFNAAEYDGPIVEEAVTPAAWQILEWCQERLAAAKAQQLEAEDEGDGQAPPAELPLPPNWRLAMQHLYTSGADRQVPIKSVACRFPAAFISHHFWVGLSGGTDFATEVPMKRFLWQDWYDPDLDSFTRMKSYAMHGVFIDGAELFDNKFFGISNIEAGGMDPTQYLLMEAGYESLHLAGFRKKNLMNALVGVYVGQGAVEAAPTDSGLSMGGTGAARAVSCGRISFALGMQGPCCAIDAHGATAFACVEVGFQSLRHQSKTFKTAIAGSVMLTFSPQNYVSCCAAGYLSPIGRCCSFDGSALGYAKSEGCAFACLQATDGQDDARLGALSAVEIASAGRAARLGAPNAPAEQAVVANALRSAELEASNVEVVECAAEGELLGDAVEAGYLGRSMRWHDPGEQPLVLGAVMSQVGFMRETAGFAQLLKTLGCLSFGALGSNLHLMSLNPHVDEVPLESLQLTTESLPCRLPSTFGGITSRGAGGTVTHAILAVQVRDGADADGVPAKGFGRHAVAPAERIAFWPVGGGGELPDGDDGEPSVGYFVVGSWAGQAEPEQMEREAPGVFGLTVTVGDALVEEFQIWLDADPRRSLRPARPHGAPGCRVLGPSSAGGEDNFWALDVREQWLPVVWGGAGAPGQLCYAKSTSGAAPGKCGDRYRIRLRTSRRWRAVDWSPVEDAPEQPSQALVQDRHMLHGSWDWARGIEMAEDASRPGVVCAEVVVAQEGATEFVVLRNGNWHEAFFPADDADAGRLVLGPGDAAGRHWRLRAPRGALLHVELERRREGDLELRSLRWRTSGDALLGDSAG